MASNPSFSATVSLGAALLGSAETDTLTPGQTSTIVTAGASGTKIEEIVVQAVKTATLVATTVAGLVYIFTYDGSTYRMYDCLTVTAVTASSTAAPFRTNKFYSNLWLPSGWSLRASQSVSGNANLLEVFAFGGDY